MAKASLESMSVDALLKLREDIGTALSRKASGLRDQLSRLGAEVVVKGTGRKSSLKGRKAPIKYRDSPVTPGREEELSRYGCVKS